MAIDFLYPQYEVVRNESRCIQCRVCERQCANEVHRYDADLDRMLSDESKCVNCHRCVALCPTRALKIEKSRHTFAENANWPAEAISDIYRQAGSGGVLLSSMGNPKPLPVYWDRLLLNASQVTNPSIDPLREPMETRVFLGKKSERIRRDAQGNIIPEMAPQLDLKVPIMFSAMSYGSISYNAHESLARAACELGTYYNTGEGGLHEDFYQYGAHTIVQVASGRFGVSKGYLEAGAAVEIKMGQGAKPGIGGHLPGAKIVGDVSRTRMIPEGADAHLPGPAPRYLFHRGSAPARLFAQGGHRIQKAGDCQDCRRAQRGGHRQRHRPQRRGHHRHRRLPRRHGRGAHPHPRQRGHPHRTGAGGGGQRLRQEGIRGNVSLVVGGSIRSSADVVKAIALGADAVYIGTAALLALGCHLCRTCHAGKCNWGIATQRPELVRRLNPDLGYQRLVNLVTAWNTKSRK